MRNKLDKCRSWNYFSLLCSSFPSQELFAFKKDVVFSVSSSQKFKLWSKINSINRKPTVIQPASKKERLLNYEYHMRKPFTATHLSYNLAFFQLKNAFYLYLWVLCLFLNALELRETISVIYWAPAKSTGIRHVNYSLFTLYCQRWRFVHKWDIREYLEDNAEEAVKGAGVATWRSWTVIQYIGLISVIGGYEVGMTLNRFPELSLLLLASFSYWVLINLGRNFSLGKRN